MGQPCECYLLCASELSALSVHNLVASFTIHSVHNSLGSEFSETDRSQAGPGEQVEHTLGNRAAAPLVLLVEDFNELRCGDRYGSQQDCGDRYESQRVVGFNK